MEHLYFNLTLIMLNLIILNNKTTGLYYTSKRQQHHYKTPKQQKSNKNALSFTLTLKVLIEISMINFMS